jgi:hypothetical protein
MVLQSFHKTRSKGVETTHLNSKLEREKQLSYNNMTIGLKELKSAIDATSKFDRKGVML